MGLFKKVLVANRGEIAVRVMRACHELNIPVVAVYSEVDKAALHVFTAEESVCIGPAKPAESYLNIDAIINAARQTGADAIHPGYGFLAENSAFSQACKEADITFIGPTPDSQALLGDKLASRHTMSAGGVPIIPGMTSAGKSANAVHRFAEKIGFPVMLKASAGGGGKGMRIVSDGSELKSAFESCRREATSAFGNDAVYVEKYLSNPRHIEFQVLADMHGHAVHLFERECSIQRRHQKIIEESPAPMMTPELRAAMGEAALNAVRASEYVNAGTVEFLVDENRHFYFLEVNARIQVEHPITEMVLGVDLVKWQIRIAAGEPLTLTQEALVQRGHAIECRIYAEDPENDFLPSLGPIAFLQEPQGPGIRVDSGIYAGFDVPVHYDPILSKLIAWGQDRNSAINRMIHALEAYIILGIKTATPFMADILRHPDFRRGNLSTGFISEHMAGWKQEITAETMQLASIAAAIAEQQADASYSARSTAGHDSPWNTLGSLHIA